LSQDGTYQKLQQMTFQENTCSVNIGQNLRGRFYVQDLILMMWIFWLTIFFLVFMSNLINKIWYLSLFITRYWSDPFWTNVSLIFSKYSMWTIMGITANLAGNNGGINSDLTSGCTCHGNYWRTWHCIMVEIQSPFLFRFLHGAFGNLTGH
jgi:hypothetical protein